jgi:hypothetical protein
MGEIAHQIGILCSHWRIAVGYRLRAEGFQPPLVIGGRRFIRVLKLQATAGSKNQCVSVPDQMTNDQHVERGAMAHSRDRRVCQAVVIGSQITLSLIADSPEFPGDSLEPSDRRRGLDVGLDVVIGGLGVIRPLELETTAGPRTSSYSAHPTTNDQHVERGAMAHSRDRRVCQSGPMTESFRIAAKSREPLAANQQKRGPETRPLKRSTKQDGRTAIEKSRLEQLEFGSSLATGPRRTSFYAHPTRGQLTVSVCLCERVVIAADTVERNRFGQRSRSPSCKPAVSQGSAAGFHCPRKRWLTQPLRFSTPDSISSAT